jgi:8-oxo-dGDP phosphatase
MSERFEVITSRYVHRGFSQVRVDVLTGPGGATFEREIVEHPDAVAMIAVDEAGRVLFVRQYRHAIGSPLLEIPAGTLDVVGEEPSAAAQRELIEEVGFRAQRLVPLGRMWNSAGWCDERTWLFLALELRPAVAPDGFIAEDEEASMSIERIGLSEALAMIADGRIDDAKTVVGLLRASVHLGGLVVGGGPADVPAHEA